jgi:diguanylate cyclase (GGDEF)-like protein
VPVEGESGVIGALTLYSMARDQYSQDHLRLLMAVGARLAFQLENSLRFLRDGADTDEITGLSNLRWLVAHLGSICQNAAAEKHPFSILAMNLDAFQGLNERFGRAKGNDALREVAKRSRVLLPPAAAMAQVGGGEFVVILPEDTGAAAERLAAQIQSALAMAGADSAGAKALSVNWGVSVFGPDGETPENLMAEAERRMKEYKCTTDVGKEESLQREPVPAAGFKC